MRALLLFSGTDSVGRYLRENGWETVGVIAASRSMLCAPGPGRNRRWFTCRSSADLLSISITPPGFAEVMSTVGSRLFPRTVYSPTPGSFPCVYRCHSRGVRL